MTAQLYHSEREIRTDIAVWQAAYLSTGKRRDPQSIKRRLRAWSNCGMSAAERQMVRDLFRYPKLVLTL